MSQRKYIEFSDCTTHAFTGIGEIRIFLNEWRATTLKAKDFKHFKTLKDLIGECETRVFKERLELIDNNFPCRVFVQGSFSTQVLVLKESDFENKIKVLEQQNSKQFADVRRRKIQLSAVHCLFQIRELLQKWPSEEVQDLNEQITNWYEQITCLEYEVHKNTDEVDQLFLKEINARSNNCRRVLSYRPVIEELKTDQRYSDFLNSLLLVIDRHESSEEVKNGFKHLNLFLIKRREKVVFNFYSFLAHRLAKMEESKRLETLNDWLEDPTSFVWGKSHFSLKEAIAQIKPMPGVIFF